MKKILIVLLTFGSITGFASDIRCTVLYQGADQDLIRALENKNLKVVDSGDAQLKLIIESGSTKNAPILTVTHLTHELRQMEFRLEGSPVFAYKGIAFKKDVAGNIDPLWKVTLYKKTKRNFIKSLNKEWPCRL